MTFAVVAVAADEVASMNMVKDREWPKNLEWNQDASKYPDEPVMYAKIGGMELVCYRDYMIVANGVGLRTNETTLSYREPISTMYKKGGFLMADWFNLVTPSYGADGELLGTGISGGDKKFARALASYIEQISRKGRLDPR